MVLMLTWFFINFIIFNFSKKYYFYCRCFSWAIFMILIYLEFINFFTFWMVDLLTNGILYIINLFIKKNNKYAVILKLSLYFAGIFTAISIGLIHQKDLFRIKTQRALENIKILEHHQENNN